MSDDITQWWGNIVTLTNKFFSRPRPYQSHKMTLVWPRPRIQTALKKLKTWGHLHELLRKNSLKVKKVTILPHLTVLNVYARMVLNFFHKLFTFFYNYKLFICFFEITYYFETLLRIPICVIDRCSIVPISFCKN